MFAAMLTVCHARMTIRYPWLIGPFALVITEA